jgi:hypothetical protein
MEELRLRQAMLDNEDGLDESVCRRKTWDWIPGIGLLTYIGRLPKPSFKEFNYHDPAVSEYIRKAAPGRILIFYNSILFGLPAAYGIYKGIEAMIS